MNRNRKRKKTANRSTVNWPPKIFAGSELMAVRSIAAATRLDPITSIIISQRLSRRLNTQIIRIAMAVTATIISGATTFSWSRALIWAGFQFLA